MLAPMATSIFTHEPNARLFRAGELIFEAGSGGKAMYAVQSGEVDLVIGETIVETVGPDGFFGEMALLEDAPRSATARARTDCTVAEIDSFGFMRQVSRNPFFALEVMRILAHRLRRADAAAKAGHSF
jgi:CRP-like cAMP-binding protein